MQYWMIRAKGMFNLGAEIVEMQVIKESEKLIKLSDGTTARQVKKSDLPVVVSSYGIITTDREAGIKKWIELINDKIAQCEESIKRYKSQIIAEPDKTKEPKKTKEAVSNDKTGKSKKLIKHKK